MTSSKASFQRQKELAEFWANVSRSTDFAYVVVYAQSAMVESGMTFEEMRGATKFLSILNGLCDADPEPQELPSPGLNHDISGVIASVRTPKTE